MQCRLNLSCGLKQNTQIKMYDKSPSMNLRDYCTEFGVFEDEWYSFQVSVFGIESKLCDLEIYLNGSLIGKSFPENQIVIEQNELGGQGFQVVFEDENKTSSKPFLLHYDLVLLSIILNFEDGETIQLYSDYLLCLSRATEDVVNIKNIITELHDYDDTQVNHWIFSKKQLEYAKSSYLEGSWRPKSYKSLKSYIQMLEQIYACYYSNLSYFRNLAKHSITKVQSIKSYQDVRSIGTSGMTWLMQNPEQLKIVNTKTSILHNGKNLLPYKMLTEKYEKNKDVYENQIVLSFLWTVLQEARSIENSFSEDIENQKNIYDKLIHLENEEFHVPILTVKKIQIDVNQELLLKLSQIISLLRHMYITYEKVLVCSIVALKKFPRKTRVFQEVKPYRQVFGQILKWFHFGEFDLHKNRVLLEIKTLDKLFEYYCLFRLLKIFSEHGYLPDSSKQSIYSYEYITNDGFYQNEYDISNTYALKKDTVDIILYYQPVIFSNDFVNGIRLFRTTGNKNTYYSPDFLMKIHKPDSNEQYAIIDSKYSSRNNIKQYYLKDEILKYCFELGGRSESYPSVKMMWLFQGRVDGDNSVYKYHNSPMSRRYGSDVSVGIVSVNSNTNAIMKFWYELKELSLD